MKTDEEGRIVWRRWRGICVHWRMVVRSVSEESGRYRK